MAITSSKPNPNPHPNPDSRNGQENMGTVRRSFSSNGSKLNKSCFVSQPQISNPIATPANTPTEYSQRSSFGRNDGSDSEQKENEQKTNPKPTRLRSPSVVKGSKSFMSPTISAASKINASPRKKVLGERNEAIRTSASYSAGKFHFYSTAPSETETYAVHDHENVQKLELENYPQTKTALVASMTATEFQNEDTENLIKEPAINLTAADDDKNELEPDVVVLSPLKSFKCDEPGSPNKELSTNSVDSMLPPYDPENNYLSPRPRFLHYKPKPRVEAYANRGIQFEDDFVLENSVETESSNEETTPSKDSGEVTPESSQVSEPSQSSRISESCESSQISESCDSWPVKENVESEAATRRKSGYFAFSKFLVFILVVSLAFSLAIHAPSVTTTLNQDQVMSKFLDESHKVADLAREHMESWCDSLKLKLVQSFGHLSSFTSGFGKVKKLGPLKYINVTDLPDYEFEKFKMDTFGVEKGSIELVGDKMEISGYDGWDYEYEQVTMDASDEQNVNIELVGDEMGILGNKEDHMCLDYPKVENDLESEAHVGFLDKSQVMQPDYLQVNELHENSEISAPEDIAVENVFEVSEAVATEQQQYNVETDHEGSGQTAQDNVDTFMGIADEPQIVIEEKEQHLSTFSTEPDFERSTPLAFEEWKVKLLEVVDSVKQILDDNMVATSIISVAALLLATILVCLKLRNNFPQQQVEGPKPLSKSIAACNIKPPISCSQSGLAPEEFEEMEGESCPSEMSSSQSVKKSTCSKRGNRATNEEVKSHERNSVRRSNHKSEALASTSSDYTMGSHSYGSFTTYSIVHSKKGDEEAVTPLRRSSRIRNKVTHS